MTYQRKSRVFLFFLFVLSEVAPWTIDLPEVRQRFFKDHEKQKAKMTDYQRYVNGNEEIYSNVQGNSKHNADVPSKMKYDEEDTNDFHQTYMGKKVMDVVKNGSAYLDGLRIALEEYIKLIEECNRNNEMNQNLTASNSSWTVPVSPSPLNQTMSFDLTSPRFQTFNVTDFPFVLQKNNSTGRLLGSSTNGSRSRLTCQEVTKTSEKVRQYASLAAWATRRLQDLAYAGQYQKTDFYEENEIILKLAWFLDKLAVLTGYEPDYKRYVSTITLTTSTTPIPRITMIPQTQELINFLIGCMKTNSSEPATVRCRYPQPLPNMVAEIVGVNSTTPSPQPAASDITASSLTDSISQQSMELLITGDKTRIPRRITKRSPVPQDYYVPLPVQEKPKPVLDFIVKGLANLKAIVKAVKKNALTDLSSQLAFHKHVHKRAIDDNMARVLNRLAKDINVKNDDLLDKNYEAVVKSDELDDRSDELIVNSDKSIGKLDNIKTNSPLYLPLSDEVVVNTKSLRKRSIYNSNELKKITNHEQSKPGNVKSVKKRSISDPLENLSNYYLKYKVWDSSNPIEVNNNKIPTHFDVSNGLQRKVVTKRSVFHKKNRHLKTIQLLQLLNSDINKKSFKKGKSKLLTYVNNMVAKNDKNYSIKGHKINKRAAYYGRLYLPRIPMNPIGDISYYVKNKRGHNYNPSLTQAAQIRFGVQQVFNTGNLAVVHRFGSNYNPANPAPFYTGVLKTIADS